MYYKWMNTQRPIVAFCGVGGSGKTTTLREVDKRLQNTNLRNGYVIVPSIVRDFYRERGIASEIEYSKLPQKDRTKFQLDLYFHYIKNMQKAVAENPGKTIISDRSLVDHFGYSFIDTPFDGEQFEELKKGLLQFYDMTRTIFVFPMQTFVDKEDKFRYTPYSRMVTLSLTIGLGLTYNPYRSEILHLVESTVKGRADEIMQQLILEE